MVQKTCSLC